MAAVEAKIAPSMLSSDFANLASEAERMLRSGADWLHMDIMDGLGTSQTSGLLWLLIMVASCKVKEIYSLLPVLSFLFRHFVPNLTIGAPVIESLRKHTNAYLDCHLMVTNPIDYVEPLGKAGASGFTFHVEASKENWKELVQAIKSKGMRAGVALKPATPVEEVYALVECENPVELVLVMTVEPGFGGQKFMQEMMDKVRALRKKFPSLNIEASSSLIIHLEIPSMLLLIGSFTAVDGGLGPSTIDAAASAGANCIVAGSSVFGAPEPAQVISLMRKSVEEAQGKQLKDF
ncbi:Ribulose-phosphate 3-epimerase-like [Dillenia turbinata]|uniref:ribulose-phosphate 3-epimerase n=1 Tax=Dillenia turbinata TaxID=194707 RepID=A0AAN8VBI7_9MAGN